MLHDVALVGLDIAKSIFHVHAADRNGRGLLRRRLKRDDVEPFFRTLPACRIGLEACPGAHHWARLLRAMGHDVQLLPAQYVRPYVKTNKNDAADAEAICEAMTRPTMRFVPITLVPPPGLELTYVEREVKRYLVGPTLRNDPARTEEIGHAINLFLELAGHCELVREDFTPFAPPLLRRVNWSMLPPGEYPWERIESHLDSVLKRTSDDTRRVILDRQATIMSRKPDEQYVGLGGFSDHIAYVFRERGLVILERIRRDNAIYVFGDGWERFSQLTKAEVLSSKVHRARIVHSTGWKERLAGMLAGRAAA